MCTIGCCSIPKPNSGIRAMGCFQLYLMQVAGKKLKKIDFFCCRDSRVDESMNKFIQLVELVHALDELDPLTAYLRVFLACFGLESLPQSVFVHKICFFDTMVMFILIQIKDNNQSFKFYTCLYDA